MDYEGLFKKYLSSTSAVTCAKMFLALPVAVQNEFVQLPIENQATLLHVANKQRNKFLRQGYGQGTVGVIAYCKFKSRQKSNANQQRREETMKKMNQYEKETKKKMADAYFV